MKYVTKLTLSKAKETNEAHDENDGTDVDVGCIILNACEPVRIRSLELHHTPVEYASRALHLFTDLTSLSLLGQTLNERVIESINALINLKKLHLMSSFRNPDSFVSIEPFYEMLSVRSLEDVRLFARGSKMPLLRQCVNLKRLSVMSSRSGNWQSVECLAELTTLQQLEIDNFHLGSGTLLLFGTQLKDLKFLKLKTCCFEDGDFANIQLLTSLRDFELDLSNTKLTGQCYADISKSKSLQGIKLSHRCLKKESLKTEIAPLIGMESLKVLTITGSSSVDSPFAQALCEAIPWTMKAGEYALIFSL